MVELDMNKTELCTTADAIRACNVHPDTIKNWVKIGKLRPFRKVGRSWVFTPEEIARVAALPRYHAGRKAKKG